MPDEVIKAETGAEILDALQGVKLIQTELRDGRGTSMTLTFLVAYHEKLPTGVARHLTEIDAETLWHIGPVTGYGLHDGQIKPLADKLVGDAAFAQVIRAANAYRAKLGYPHLGPDDWPEKAGADLTNG